MIEDFAGKTAVLTGAGSGFGLECARIGMQRGMNLVLVDVQQDALDAAESEAIAAGCQVLARRVDVSDAAQMEQLAQAVHERFGAPHFVFNNAGVGAGGLVWENSVADWNWVLGVNLYGVVHGISAFVPRLVAQGEGHVVNTASVLGVVAAPVFGPYVASKHAVVGLSESLHHDLALMGSPVRVSVVCPSWVNTGLPDAERNWPDRLGPAPTYGRSTQAMRETLSQVVAAGLEPGDVATQVLDAVRSGRFWVFPHSELATAAVERMQAAAEGRAPAMPAALLQGPPSPA